MRGFWPRSLTGQLALIMTLALLLASAVNFGLLLQERRLAGLNEASGPAVTRFADLAAQMQSGAAPARSGMVRPRPPGLGRVALTEASWVDARSLPRDRRLERRVQTALRDAGAQTQDVRAATRLVERPVRGGRLHGERVLRAEG